MQYKSLKASISHWFACNRNLILVTLLLGGFWFCFSQGWLSGMASWFNQSAILAANTDYLANLETQLLADYTSLLLLSSVVDVAASSQFGLSFIFDMNVQVGELLNNLAQVLEQGKDYLLMAIAAIGALEVIAMLSDFIAPYLFELLLFVVFIWCLVGLFYRKILHSVLVTHVIKLIAILFLVTHIAIPYSIHLSSGATHVVNKMLGYQHSHQYFNFVAEELSAQQTLAQKSDLRDKGKTGVHFLHKASAAKLNHKVQRSSHVVMRSAAQLLLTLVLIPGLLLLFNFYLFRLLLGRVVHRYLAHPLQRQDPLQ